ncbi:MAG: diguanylate cyclase [Alphaproteobacteria bacterium]|nr:diguanylate cyclase [Alphaproteobacteria bacterium]
MRSPPNVNVKSTFAHVGTTRYGGVVAGSPTVLAAVRALEIPHAHSKAAAIVTASIGAASLVASPDAPATLLVETADGALCRAKEGGRNRVVAAG